MTTVYSMLEEYQQGFAELAQLDKINYAYNPRTLVHRQDKVTLFHYQPIIKNPLAEPVLVVFATVNRPEILDLFPDKSFIRGLLNQGLDVYLLDWGYPDSDDHAISFSDYVCKYLAGMVKKTCSLSKQSAINLIGVCQGGVISLCYTSFATNIKKIVLISTPIDFHTDDNLIAKVLQRIEIKNNNAFKKNVAGSWLTQFFISLRPFELLGKKYLRFCRQLHDVKFKETFLQVEKWLHDAPDQPRLAFTQLLKQFYQGNGLIKKEIKLRNKNIVLENIQVPVLNVMAKQDEIVPISSSQALKNYISNNLYHEMFFDSGHIGIYISEKVGLAMPKQIADWLLS